MAVGLLFDVSTSSGFFFMFFIALGASAPLPLEQQILQHFNPIMDEIRLTKVANILAEMRSVTRMNKLQPNSTESTPTKRNLSLEFPFSRNGAHLLTSPKEKYLFEGDILLTLNQAKRIFDTKSEKPATHKRAALIALNHMTWEVMPIHYVFHESLYDSQIETIRTALGYWQSHTCVTFSEITQADPAFEGDFVVFYRGDGCYSMVGRAGGSQGISVGAQCTKAGLIAHEIGHVLGLWHEQSRPDSSCCIKVVDENIQQGFQINFRQRPTQESQTYGLPYDLGSVMHYRSNAFAKEDRLHTIETVDPGYQRTIGQRVSPSFIDVQAINKAYCTNRCRQELSCFYGGYTHPSLCSECLCPDGLGGIHCEREAPSVNAKCGGVITVDNRWSYITSPNYPSAYGFNQRCNWIIKAQPGFRVRLEFEYFDISCNAVTCFDYVELKLDNREFSKTGMRYCCNDAPSGPVYAYFNEMVVIFNSETHSKGGFKAKITQYPS